MTNEILSVEQLDEISGGDVYESADDSQFLNKLNGSCDRYGELKLALANRENEIRNGWATRRHRRENSYGRVLHQRRGQ